MMNAIFIDGVGRVREMDVLDVRPEYLIPVPRHVDATYQADPVVLRPTSLTAVFRLSSIQDDRAYYRFVRVEER